MSKKIKNQSTMNNSNQTLNQKPFDVLMNEHFGTYQKNGTSNNWFIPIIKEQSMMDKILKIQSSETDEFNINWDMERIFPKISLECNKDENGNIISMYVLYKKGGKLYKVISHKDYGIIKSRMELKNNKYIPYEKCDLVPYSGTVLEYKNDYLIKSISYKNGVKDGECITYFYNNRYSYNSTINTSSFEKIVYKNGKKNGEYVNKKTFEQGNYINDKKIGVWRIKGNQLINEIHKSYQDKCGLNKYNVEDFVKKQLPFNINPNYKYQVYYVNDILNGEFEINEWKGEFHLGFVNGKIYRESSSYNSTEKHTINLVDGLRDGSDINYEYDDYNDDESIIDISNYRNGTITSFKKLSTNKNGIIPKTLTRMTKNHLNEEVFDTLTKNNMNIERYSLDDFLKEWVIMEHIEYDDNKSITNKILIENNKLKYTSDYRFSVDDYLVQECGYPYYTEQNVSSVNMFRLKKSEEYDSYSESYIPRVFSISDNGKPKQLLINGILVNEKIEDKINPIVFEFQKEEYQKLSDSMKISFENEVRDKEYLEKLKIEKEQKIREELGLSINSFPID
jgi:hypothetical protein